MRARFLFVLAVLFPAIGIQAQDTIGRVSPKYYVNHPHWTDDTMRLDTGCATFYYTFAANAHGETAKQCYTKDSLKIYGVAAAIAVGYDAGQSESHIVDTSYDSVCEYFRLYKRDSAGGLGVIAQTQVCALDSIVGYLMFVPEDYHGLMGIYESYFEDGPITVEDTFYVGLTQYLDTQAVFDNMNKWLTWRMALGTGSFYSMVLMHIPTEEVDVVYLHDKYSGWQKYKKFVYIFPIYNPNEVPSPAPEGIADRVEGLERHITVSPSPAQTEVSVVSSFPIRAIEVYNATGQQVYSMPASGSQAILDVREWPSGTYVLNVNTQAGMFAKKVAVAR